MKILAFAATSSTKSINQKLVKYAASLLPDADIELLDINDYELPLFSEDREAELGRPELAKAFLEKIAHSDALLISFAEHNGSYTVAYKNLFDWASRINSKVFQGKPMILLSTSPGPGGGASVLAAAVASAPFFKGDVKGSLSIPSFYENFDVEQERLVNEDIGRQLAGVMNRLLVRDAVELKRVS